VHGEVFPLPVAGGAEASELLGNGAAGLLLPVPDLFDEFFPAQVMARYILRIELALDHDLGRDPGMIRARNEYGVVSAHAVIAHQAVHHRLIEGMAHMQRARDIRRRKLDHERLAAILRRSVDMLSAPKIAARLPFGVPARFEVLRFKA